MMQKIQRFGAAMFVPVLLFAFAGITAGISILFMNPDIMGSIASPGTMWFKFWFIIQEGAWTVFRQLPLLFVVGLPIALATKAQARACLESLVLYLTFNYFVSAILSLWGTSFGVDFSAQVGGTSGLTMIAGIKTLDTGMIGAILIAGIVVYLHNKYFETKLPEYLGIFQGSSFVVMIGFFVMLPIALLMCVLWPKVQSGIASLQVLLSSSGVFGVWLYTFLERILIPTGLHHFIYGPFIFGPAVVENGIATYWPAHLREFATTAHTLKEMFPAGGFALHGMSKIFGAPGIALAIYSTAKPEKKKLVAGLLIPATLTAIIAGITEPLEFTFLFIAPVLFVVHSILAATLSATAYAFGVVGNFGGGIIEWLAQNWLPLFKYHYGTYITQIVIGLCFTSIYFGVFRFAILKFNFITPGREEDDAETKLYTKADYKAKRNLDVAISNIDNNKINKAKRFLEALGGKDNIQDVTNCATRLRVTVRDENKVAKDYVFKEAGAHGVVRNGKAIQIIVGLSVPQVREEFETLLI
ncbi:alpha-glucoside-specific PTS transporter subunit IIBC [Thermobrachium celere]|uniref:alpha-glucoside-specific PTS transporter subunit IIBC n=1 Tax=Thermobrachium celere TaxID=53422 RepID=UPI0019409EB9|nr:alpha-glucoside-specific PTS transporter subunit IIBC [Thermobrachium celere]GFR34592.1 PTS alpha-glucoside transporter subunit IIBC [Thermobrachium celere]